MKACSKAFPNVDQTVHFLMMIKQLLLYRISLNHKLFQSRKETAYHPNPAANRNCIPPSVRLLVSEITYTDAMNNLNKRTWFPRIQKLNNRMFSWKYKPLGVALTQAFCGPWIKKTVMKTVYKEGRYEGSIELTADYYLYQHLLKFSVCKLLLWNQNYLGRKFFREPLYSCKVTEDICITVI